MKASLWQVLIVLGFGGCGTQPQGVAVPDPTDTPAETEFEDVSGSEVPAETVPRFGPLDGSWQADVIYESGQDVVGFAFFVVYVRSGLPECVNPHSSGAREARNGFANAPVDGEIRIRTSFAFSPYPLFFESFETFQGESLVEVTITGSRVGTDEISNSVQAPVYQVEVLEKFVFSDVVLKSSGTMKHFNYCVAAQSDCQPLSGLGTGECIP